MAALWEKQLADNTPDFVEINNIKDKGFPVEVSSEFAAQGSFVLEGNIPEDFGTIQQDLATTGSSPLLKQAEDLAKNEQRRVLKQTLVQTLNDPNLSEASKQSFAANTLSAAEEDVAVPVWQEFKDAIQFSLTGDGDVEFDSMQNSQFISEIVPADETKIQDLASRIVNQNPEITGDWLDGASGIGETLIPFNEADNIIDLHNSVMDKETGVLARLLPGEAVHDMKVKFASLDRNGQIEFAKKVGQFFRDNDGLFKDSLGFSAMIQLSAILDPNFVPGEDFDGSRLIENVANILDLVGVGSLARSFKNAGKTVSMVSRLNPRLSERLGASVWKDPHGQVRQALNLSKGDVAFNFHYPAREVENLTGAPSDVISAVARIEDEINDLQSLQILDNPTIARIAREKADNYFSGKIHINKTVAKAVDDNTLDITVTVGRASDSGFKGIRGAKQAARRRGLAEDEVTLLRRSTKTGKLVKIKQGKTVKKDTEVFYQFKKREAVTHNEILREADINLLDVNTKFFGIPLGKKIRFIKDIRAVFNSKSADKLAVISDKENAIKAAITNLTRTYSKLNKGSRQRVLELYQLSARQRKVFSYEDAVTGGPSGSFKRLTNEEYLGYRELRGVSDLNWSVKNKQLSEELKNLDMRAIPHPDGFNFYGKEVTSLSDVKGINTALDLSTGKPINITKVELEQAKLGKGKFFRLRGRETYGKDQVQFVYVSGSKQLDSITDIPQVVLPKIEGYNYKLHEDNFFVTKVDPTRTLNGKKVDVSRQRQTVVASSNIEGRAASYVEELMRSRTAQEIEDGVEYSFRFAREHIESNPLGSGAYDFAKAKNLLNKGKRGPEVVSIGEDTQNLISVADEIRHSIAQTARGISTRAVVSSLEEEFTKTFKALMPKNKQQVSVFPSKVDDILPAISPETKILRQKAAAAYEYIDFLRRYDDPVTNSYNKVLFSLGNYLEGKNTLASRGLLKTGKVIGNLTGLNKRDPLDVLRGFTFQAGIALNPLRQLPLQIAQHFVLTPLLPKYTLSGRLYKETGALIMGAAKRTTKGWKAYLPKAAKKMGMGEKEFTKYIDDWMSSGLNQIDSHSFLHALTVSADDTVGLKGVEAVAAGLGNAVGAPARFGRKFGFEAGEIGNLALSYNMARQLLIKEGVKLTSDSVAGRARNLAFMMNRTGEFAYQRGWLKNATQFFSFQHKALLSLLPENLGGVRGFTNVDKAKMATTQLLLFGAEGLGIYSMGQWVAKQYVDATGEPIPDGAYQALLHGTFNFAANEIIQEIAGDDTSINFAEVAPLSGSAFMINSTMDFMFNNDKNVVTKLLGASASIGGKLIEEVEFAAAVMGLSIEGKTDEKVLLALQHIAQGSSSGFSNFMKGHIALQTGFLMSHENKLIAATAAEANAKMLFGLNPTEVRDYYEIKADVQELAESRQKAVDVTIDAMIAIAEFNQDDDKAILMEKIKLAGDWRILQSEEEDAATHLLFQETFLKRLRGGDSKAKLLMDRMLDAQTYDSSWTKQTGNIFITNEEDKVVYDALVDEMFGTPENNLNTLEQDN